MNRRIKFLIIAVAVLFVGSIVWIIFSNRPTDNTFVEIVQNNNVIYSFDLSKEKNRTFKIESDDGGWNEIKIENGNISISDADCPDHTCVKTGVLRSETIPIVCLPHRLVIRFAEKEQK